MPSFGDEVIDRNANTISDEKLLIEIDLLTKQNAGLLSDLNKQNAYDLSMGKIPGKFRETFVLTTIDRNNDRIQQLKAALGKPKVKNTLIAKYSIFNVLPSKMGLKFISF